MLQRMRELAVQSANGTYGTTDRSALDSEFKQLQAEITRISNMTQWNGTNVTDDTATSATFQVGANASQSITVVFKDLDGMTGMSAAVHTTSDIASAGNASTAISTVDTALQSIDT